MKRDIMIGTAIILCLLWAGAMVYGCAGVADAVYGPDLTPNQLTDAVYQDAYALGAIWATREPDKIADLIQIAQAVKLSPDPRGLLSEKWLQSLRERDTESAFVYYAALRLYDRVGVRVDADALNLADLRPDLLALACDAYIEGVKSLQGS